MREPSREGLALAQWFDTLGEAEKSFVERYMNAIDAGHLKTGEIVPVVPLVRGGIKTADRWLRRKLIRPVKPTFALRWPPE